jgi:predicted transcriptional regulator
MITIPVENNIRTHENLIATERTKYSNDWLTFTEVHYGNYIFDLMAINPKTREIQITEIDVSSPTHEAKKVFIETFATFRLIKINDSTKRTISAKSYSPIAKIIASSPRMAILELLYEKRRATYTEIAISIGLNPTKTAGRFGYHLKLLIKSGLLRKSEGIYSLTEKGDHWVSFLMSE